MIADGATASHLSHPIDTQSFDIPATPHAFLLEAWKPDFPTPELLSEALALMPVIHHGTRELGLLDEGPRSYIRVGPGVIRLGSKDLARAARTAENALHRRQVDVELLARYLDRHGRFPGKTTPTRVISEWSRRSRSRMIETIGMLDFSGLYADPTRLPCMITLTYPGCWITVAPSGKTLKGHLKALRKRYKRAFGEDMACLWKLEFQGREGACDCETCDGLDDGRAPHVHMLMLEPTARAEGGQVFRDWLSQAWADVVDHPDPVHRKRHLSAGTRVDTTKGLDCKDPKRVSVYFAKHGVYSAKEYQHVVPLAWQTPETGPGRFWGYWALTKATVVAAIPEYARVLLGRTLRRWSRAQRTTRRLKRKRFAGGRVHQRYADVQGLAGAWLLESYDTEPKRRYSRGRAVRLADNRGYVMVNSGPEMLSQLARYLDRVDQDRLFR